jgi:hypothetical protein
MATSWRECFAFCANYLAIFLIGGLMSYCCSICGAAAYYDGRCGDGPILTCGCDKGQWINDGRGGYYDNPARAKPIKDTQERPKKRRKIIIIEEDIDDGWE